MGRLVSGYRASANSKSRQWNSSTLPKKSDLKGNMLQE